MGQIVNRAIAIVGVGAVMPDAPNVPAFWDNIRDGRYSIRDVPADRWNPELYYDPDPLATAKTYSRIGGWVREFEWEPMKWRLPIPPKVGDMMDRTQKWAVVATRQALADFGYPERAINTERTAVILGNAMAGDLHYITALRILSPEITETLRQAPSFEALPEEARRAITAEMAAGIERRLPPITEDTMPGELANIIAGRVANLFDFHGPNFVCDAACASTLAAIDAAVEGLEKNDYDMVVTGGVDANMSASTFTKFCKIGALSATGTRPYADGADGFVMGEGSAVFLLKRLADAERDGDRIYAVIRGIGGASDGRGKGITAPNPVGQTLAVRRAWQNAGLSPATAGLIEGHGTSTRVGDVVEVQSLTAAFGGGALERGSIPLGSVKSNIGHLKGAAGAAGMLKLTLALRDKVLPPSLNFERPNPNIDFDNSPFFVNTELREWPASAHGARSGGLSAFGFGGTNFHLVLEEHIPGRLSVRDRDAVSPAVYAGAGEGPTPSVGAGPPSALKAPIRGCLVIGGADEEEVTERLRRVHEAATAGRCPAPTPPLADELRAAERLTIDFGDAEELATKCEKALKALTTGSKGMWRALRARGIFRGKGEPGKVAFLYTGQGSQYVNMLQDLRASERVVADTFDEADAVMTPLLGKPLSEFIFVDNDDPEARERAAESLRQTSITQPAMLATDVALHRLLAEYGIHPDMVMGHSLGEYGALVAAEVLTFAGALEAVSARGREMTKVSVGDNGMMAAVFAPLETIQNIVESVDGYVVVANINSTSQAVIGGQSAAVEAAMKAFHEADFQASRLPVSHAFHTSIVAPASEPLERMLRRITLQQPKIPIISNVTGDFYPTGEGTDNKIVGLLAQQIAAPVQFVKGMNSLYDAGARIFVEVGPKKALYGFVEDLYGRNREVSPLFTNHPKLGDAVSFNLNLCGAYAVGLGASTPAPSAPAAVAANRSLEPATPPRPADQTVAQPLARPLTTDRPTAAATPAPPTPAAPTGDATFMELGRMFADVLQRGMELYSGAGATPATTPAPPPFESPVITGAALGLPGTERVFDDGNLARLMKGEQLLSSIPMRFRELMVDKNITRLVKSADGGPRFETIDSPAGVIKIAARLGEFDLGSEFGFPEDRLPALDLVTRLAIGAGLDALRDAGIPLVMRYKTTTTGTQLPDRWGLPESMRDRTGVIFASAFPGYDSFAREMGDYYKDRSLRLRLADLRELREQFAADKAGDGVVEEIERRIHELETDRDSNPYAFERRFLFQVLSMGHSQFAEFIGARGPNVQTNGACASTSQAISVAEDWIRADRCDRVVVISADTVTTDNTLEWFGAGFVASGAAATDERIEDAAIPFDRRRHGLLIGTGASGLVVESPRSAAERGIAPICEVLATTTANSAFHGSRLDIQHISGVMEEMIARAEVRCGIDRHQIAPETVFVSHETYTPARGGSAQAEVDALRRTFGASIDNIVIANTKGFTGHPMAVGIEEVVAVKALETGQLPPVANLRELDPDLGALNLSQGGEYPIRYALRLGAGFGSQISMALLRWVPTADGRRRKLDELGPGYRITDRARWDAWLREVTGYSAPEIKVVQRSLKVRDEGPPGGMTPKTVAAAPRRPAEAEMAAPAVEPQPAAAGDGVQERVLEIVAEQTGYPPDMLDLDLDLEADLGIDTVKQAEMFAAIRGEWDIPREEDLQLRDFPTLADTIQFVYDRRPDLAEARGTATAVAAATTSATPGPTTSAGTAPVTPSASDRVQERVLEIVAEQTGYPPDMLDLDLDLEADLGIDTVKQAEMFAAIRGEWDIPREEDLQLREFPTLADTIRFVYDRRPDLAEALAEATGAAESTESATTAPAAADSEPAPPPTSAEDDDAVQRKVLEIVAEQTGYPPDMLDLDLDLEADLGIDTVKQAEMFAAIRGEWDIPREEDLQLREFPTLADTIRFVYDRRPDLAAGESTTADDAAPQPEAVDPASAPAAEPEDATYPRRIPVAVLRPALDLCRDSGVTLDAESRIVVMPDRGGVAKALSKRLEKLGATVLSLDPDAEGAALDSTLHGWIEEGGIDGVYWLPALDPVGDLTDLDPAEWRRSLSVRVKHLYRTMRALYEQIGAPGTFLVSATRLGGRHGYDDTGALEPLGGAVTGFSKAFKRERPETQVKCVDFPAGRQTAAFADLLLAETLSDPGVVEVGHVDGQRWGIGMEEQPRPTDGDGMRLDGDSVYVVTGAAGSIVSAIVSDLATSGGGTFHLLDLAPQPDPDDPDLALFGTDREALQRRIFERIKESGERATPAKVEREMAGIERRHAAYSALASIRAAGGTAHYHQVDLLDADRMAEVMASIRSDTDRVDLLLHAGGLEISRSLADKEPPEFDLVFDVKADGWYHLMRGLEGVPIGATVVFSSIAGRFGNNGQTDYSSANDLLCKLSSALRRQRPTTRALALDWTAWGGIGMATRGSIPTVMKAAGIDMLPPEIGVPYVRRELTAGSWQGEIVVAGSLGVMADEWDESGGLDPDRLTTESLGGIMTGRPISMSVYDGLTVETSLDPSEQPFLDDHRIDGTPVLPGVMGVEAFAEIARLPFPDRHVASVEEIDFLAPLKFYRDEPRTLSVHVAHRLEGAEIVADCRLVGARTLPGLVEPQLTTHFTATVRLSGEASAPRSVEPPPSEGEGGTSADEIYRVYFHGPAYQVLSRAWRADDRLCGLLTDPLPLHHRPEAATTLIGPRLIELCFQTAGIWQLGTRGTMGLPHHVDRIVPRAVADSGGPLVAVVRRSADDEGVFDAEVVDARGAVVAEVHGYRTIELPGNLDPDLLTPLKGALTGS